METVQESELRVLVDAGAVRGVRVLADGRAWYAVLDVGRGERLLASKRRTRREYRDLDRLVSMLRDAGIGHVQVDATHYSPQQGVAA